MLEILEFTNDSRLWVACLMTVALLIIAFANVNKPNLDAIPTVGHSGPFLSWFGALNYVKNGPKMLQEGYDKYKSGIFKVPNVGGWLVVITSGKLVEELRQATDNELSFMAAVKESFQTDYTLGEVVHTDTYHITIIRTKLTHNLSVLFPHVHDEIVASFNDVITLSGQEWTAIPALDTVMQVVCRASSRTFVGLPLCRDPDYQKLAIQFTIDVVTAGTLINMFPNILKPLAGRIFSTLPKNVKQCMKHLKPIVEERQRDMKESGMIPPADMLSWLISECKGFEDLTLRILTLNFTSIHSTSMAFTHALYDLAANPQYIQPLREEIEANLADKGWTKAGMDKMRKVDSFLKESMRLHGFQLLTMDRLTTEPFTFSDGTYLPAGTYVYAAAASIHTDEDNYPNATQFDPFRFSTVREDNQSTKRHLVSTATDFIPFGHGKHSCPGRFFVANEMKTMLAHIVINYDVKFEEGVRPQDEWFTKNCIPNRKARVLFRARQK